MRKMDTPSQFTKEFADALRAASPGLKIEVVNNLELKVVSADGHESTFFLDNAYTTYKQEPGGKQEVITRFISDDLEYIKSQHSAVDRTRIVPVIKDRPWLEETRQALLSRGTKEVPEPVYEDFSPDLIILYAEDSPKNIRYLTPKDLEALKIEKKDLRSLACENLKRVIPKIERHGTNGLYMLTAGGDYEASLLLLDSLWNNSQMPVQGEILVAIPTRDLLLVTGTGHPEAVEKVKQMANKSFEEGSYRLTPKLFIYRNGRFSDFKTSGGTGAASNAALRNR